MGLNGNVLSTLPQLDVSQSVCQLVSQSGKILPALCTPNPYTFGGSEPESWDHAGVPHIAAVKGPGLLFPPGTESHFTLCLEALRSNVTIYLTISNT